MLEDELHVALDLALREAQDQPARLEALERLVDPFNSPIPSRTPRQKDCPITDAWSSAARVSDGRASMRAAIAARTVVGSSSLGTSSVIEATSSSRNSGFPSATETTRSIVDAVGGGEERRHHGARVPLGERLERKGRLTDAPATPRPRALEELRPGEGQDHDARIPDVRGDVVDQLDHRVARPVHILEHEEERLSFGQMLDEHPHRELQVDRLVGRIVESETEDQAEEPGRLGGLLRREQRVDGFGELGAGGPGRIVLVDAGDAPDDPADASVRRLLLVREAPTPEGSPSQPFDPLGGLARDPRLADTGRADDRHDVWATVLDGSLPDAVEERELAVAPDERSVRRGPAARRLERLEDRPGGDRRCLPLRADGGDRLEPERMSREPMRLLADEEAARRGGVLQTGGRVHDVAGRERLPGVGSTAITASPVQTAPRTSRSSPSFASLSSWIPSRIERPARTARSASSTRASGAPKTAMTASPMYFSTIPPWRSIRSRASWK